MRISLLDDEPDIVAVMRAGLELKGFQVDSFTDSNKAIDHFKADTYDIVLTDIKMPIMNGFEFHDKIRVKDRGVKVYFLSAFDRYENEVKELYPDKRLTGFIRKPISYSVLAQKLLSERDNT